ncbi:MAG: hypothetical protein HZB51_25490 [Chloroflexi bacterium]|nr:hypothetical protein [Chloroflexota bacterium]
MNEGDKCKAKIITASTTAGLIAFFLMLLSAPSSAETIPSSVRLIKSDVNSVVIELTTPTYALGRQSINELQYDTLSTPGMESNSDVPGNPQLPMRGVLIGVPQGAEITVRVLTQDAVEIPQRLKLLPIPSPRVDRPSFDTKSYAYAGGDHMPNPQAYAQNKFEPVAPVRLGTAGFLRSQRFAQIEFFPFQYNAAQQRVRWIKRLTIEVQFAFPQGQPRQTVGELRDEGMYERVLQNRLLNYSSARFWRAPGTPGARRAHSPHDAENFKIAINQTGMYRMTFADLTTAGVPSSVDPRTFKIKKTGVEIPIVVNNESSGVFDSSVSIDFFALGVDTVYTDTNIYWLSYGGANHLPVSARSEYPSTVPTPTTFRDRLRIEENHFYVGDRPPGNGDHWYWNVVATFDLGNQFFIESPATYAFTLTNASNAGSATLRANVFGAAGNVGDAVPHHQQIFLNGTLIKDDSWVGDVSHQTETAFAQSLLVSGTNTISLTLPNDTGLGYDEVFANWFELDYDHLYAARNDYLAFTSEITGDLQITVTNFTTDKLLLYDVTNPGNVIRLPSVNIAKAGGSYSLSFSDSLTSIARYVALAESALKSPLSISVDSSASDLRNPLNAADEIIIAADDFYTATAPLATFRNSQGLRVARVRMSDVYDEFSDGVFDPIAIRDFLAYAFANWQLPAPMYVLLVGDGNLNYRNYQPNNLGVGYTSVVNEPNYVPPYLDAVDPFINVTATDNRYVSFVGNDIAPDMAIGRLPVRSAAEATAVIDKIIAYEQSPVLGDWRNSAAFITDNYYTSSGGTDAAGNFYATADGIIAGYIPNTYTVTRVYYDPAPSPPNPGYAWHYTTIGSARNAITSALNSSARFVNYIGHGSQFQWATETLFGNSGASLNLFDSINHNGRTPILLELTCKTGMFHLPGVTTLAESFIRADGQGAVADWASTGLGVNAGHDALAQGFYTAIFTDSVRTLGLAVNSSKLGLVAQGSHADLVEEFTLFGDPATVVNPNRKIYMPLVVR